MDLVKWERCLLAGGCVSEDLKACAEPEVVGAAISTQTSIDVDPPISYGHKANLFLTTEPAILLDLLQCSL